LDDVMAVEEILHALGLSESFLYEKYRADYILEGLVVSLDEAPMGCFLELEGPPAAIEAGTRKLELRLEDAISLAYPRLYQLFRDDVPDAPEFMVFSGGKDRP
jgi:adenylate cyclase class 2